MMMPPRFSSSVTCSVAAAVTRARSDASHSARAETQAPEHVGGILRDAPLGDQARIRQRRQALDAFVPGRVDPDVRQRDEDLVDQPGAVQCGEDGGPALAVEIANPILGEEDLVGTRQLTRAEIALS